MTSRIELRYLLPDDYICMFDEMGDGVFSVIRPLVVKICQRPNFAVAGIQCHSTVISLYKMMCVEDKVIVFFNLPQILQQFQVPLSWATDAYRLILDSSTMVRQSVWVRPRVERGTVPRLAEETAQGGSSSRGGGKSRGGTSSRRKAAQVVVQPMVPGGP